MVTLGLYPVDDPSSYGLVRRAEDGAVLGFLEKPDPAEIDTDEVNAGTYVVERAALDLIPAGRAVSIEREVFPRLVGQGLYGRRLDGYWMDIGTPERYLQASWDILDGTVETELAGDGGPYVGDGAELAETASIDAACGDRCGLRGGRWRYGFGVRAARGLSGRGGGGDLRFDPRGGCRGRRWRAGGPGAVIGAEAKIASGAAVGEGARVAPGESIEAEVIA